MQKTLWLSEELQYRAWGKMHGILCSKRKDLLTSPEIRHIRKSIRQKKPIPLKIEQAQRYMLNWLKAWAVIYRQTQDLRSYSGSIWLRGIYSTVELDHGEEEMHTIFENEHDRKDSGDDEVVATFRRITALQIEKLHTGLTEETDPAGKTEADVTQHAAKNLSLRHRSSSIIQSIEQVDNSAPAKVPIRAIRKESMAMSLNAVSSNDLSPGKRNQAAAVANDKVRGAFRKLFSVMHRPQTPSSPPLGDTATEHAHGPERLLLTPIDTDDIESQRRAMHVNRKTSTLRPAHTKEIIDLTGDGEDDTPSSEGA